MSIPDLVSEVVALVHSVLERNRVSLRVEVPKDLPPVLANHVQLRQVVLNLIVNAVEAMSSTEGRERSLVVRCALNEARDVLIMVEDSGPGIDPGDMDRIFDPFFTTKASGRGTGLGLSVSYGIIKEHAGKVDVRSTPGKGTSFRLEFPVARKPVHA